MSIPAVLALEDGSVFFGQAIGACGHALGEVVFNTAMTGYQEILTDPSYTKQIVTLTYPHIGNTGCNNEDEESANVWSAGLVIRDLPKLASSWRLTETLPDYLKRHNVVAIAGIDTRRLTRILREKGAQKGCILTAENSNATVDEAKALSLAHTAESLKGLDLAKVVSVKQNYSWAEGSWSLGQGFRQAPANKFKVVAYDFGVKRNILRMLVDRGCKLIVVPAKTSASAVLAMQPDGVFLSNGPGDPEPCDYAIEAVKAILAKKIPVFGICLGHQILALASGAKTEKMKFGHHGANHPVENLKDNSVLITSQNHGFAVAENSLPATLVPTHRSLFDKSLQGIERSDVPAFSFQGHPEASPGPHDASPLFDHFIELMLAAKN